MSRDRPVTTLFMLVSVDGKISTGAGDEMDMDQDLPNIKGVAEGLHQYYELEQQTDLHSLNTGRVQAKIGANERTNADKTPVSFIVIDNKPHLTEAGVHHFMNKSMRFFLVTTNKDHPAFKIPATQNLEIIYYERVIDFEDLFAKFKSVYNIETLTIQSGGTLNAVLLKQDLIDYVSIVIAPCLIGGKNTPTMVDGPSFSASEQLKNIKALELLKCEPLENSYLHLTYKVNH